METQKQIDHLIELAIVQRAELAKIVQELPQLRTFLLNQINATIEDIEPDLRSDLIELCDDRTDGKIEEVRAFFISAKDEFRIKSNQFFAELEAATKQKYQELLAEREVTLNFAQDSQAQLQIAAEKAVEKLPEQVSALVEKELARFPRAGEIDQLRKEFSEPRSLNPRGKWKPNETYQKLDLVAYNGDSFISNFNDNKEKPSRSSAAWTLSAARGNASGIGGITSLNDLLGNPAGGIDVVGADGSNYVRKTLTAGTNVTITESASDITISSTGGGGGGSSDILNATVTNAESVAITKGQVVYAYSATGNRLSVKLAVNTSDATSAKTFGVVADASISAGGTGTVRCVGVLDGLDTSTYTEGATVYLSSTAGAFTETKPYAPNHLVYVGIIERTNAGNGQLYVKIQNGYELDEIHDVQITSAPAAGAVLIRDATNSLWKAATITGTSGQVTVTNADASTTLSLPTAITNVNSLTAQSATNLTLNGGSSGASIVAGQGTNANITLTPSGTGFVTTACVLKTTNTTSSTSTTSGALQVGGGVGVAGAGYFGGNLTITNSGAQINITDSSGASSSNLYLNRGAGYLRAYFDGSGHIATSSADLYIDSTYLRGTNGVFTTGVYSPFHIAESGSHLRLGADGSEKVRITTAANLLVGSTTDISGSGGLKIYGTTASTSTTSGALQVSGGVGVAGNIYSGGSMYSKGGLVFVQSLGTGTTDQSQFLINNDLGYAAKFSVLNSNYANDGVAGNNRTELTAPFSLNIVSGQLHFWTNPSGAGEGTSGAYRAFSIYGATFGGQLQHTPNAYSGTPTTVAGAVGAFSSWRETTYTDSITAASGTASATIFHYYRQPTLAATNTGVTTTDAATVYIGAGPAAGTNQTITNSWSLWAAGKVRIDGKLSTAASATGSAGLSLPHGSAPTSPVNGDLWTTTAGLYARINGTTVGPYGTGGTGGTGTVTDVSVVTANGVSGSVANSTTTPAITLTLGAITPTSVNSVVLSGSSTPTLAVTGTSSISGTHSGTSSGTNTGDQTITLTSDVTGSGTGSFATTIAAGVVSNSKLANVATATIKGRTTAGTGSPEDLTGTQATALLDAFTASLKGLAPASGGGTTNFLRADGTWAAPSGGSGTVTSSGSPTVGQFAKFTTSTDITGVSSTGSGNVVLATTPTIATPVLSGIVVSDGANVNTANAMGALAIDVTKGLNTKSISADSTFTFSATPATANTFFSVFVTNTDTASHTLTIPSSYSIAAAATITTCTIPASGKVHLTWRYDGTNYFVYGDPVASGAGTVTDVSVVTANGVSGTVATSTTTPAITLSLGAITPTSVNGITFSGSSTPTLAITGTTSVSGGNTGDQTIALTGDVTGSGTGSFATTIANSAVTNAKLANSSVTIGSTSIALGATSTSLAGLTTVAATGIVSFTNSTASTLTTNGALVVTGGVGVGGAVNTGGAIVSSSTVSGTNLGTTTAYRLVGRQIINQGTTTYTSSAGVTRILARMIGAGGGGAGVTGAATSVGAGGGGGGGSYAEKFFTVAPSTGYTCAVGAGGTAGAATGATGGTGGNTTLTVGATTVTCNGGTGGVNLNAGTALGIADGGAGGAISTNGDVNIQGTSGGYAIRLSSTVGSSGSGGAGWMGAGGGDCQVAAAAGIAGGLGAGGSGGISTANTNRAGGAGGNGLIVIEEYAL